MSDYEVSVSFEGHACRRLSATHVGKMVGIETVGLYGDFWEVENGYFCSLPLSDFLRFCLLALEKWAGIPLDSLVRALEVGYMPPSLDGSFPTPEIVASVKRGDGLLARLYKLQELKQ